MLEAKEDLEATVKTVVLGRVKVYIEKYAYFCAQIKEQYRKCKKTDHRYCEG